MKALRLHGVEDLRLDTVPEPPEPGWGEVLVAPLVGGICGTDVSMYLASGGWDLPQIICHEFVARVVMVGAGVTRVAVGDRAAIVPIEACGRCDTCIDGHGELCPGHRSVGLRHPWGGFAEYALVNETQLARVPDEVTTVQAALVEPLSVATTGVVNAGVTAGDQVLVVGGGPIGLLAAMMAQAKGAARIVISERNPGRRSRAVALGFDVIDPAAVNIAEYCKDTGHGAGFDAAIDCAGNAGGFVAAMEALRPLGRIAINGLHSDPVPIDLRKVVTRGLTITAGLAYPLRSFDRRMAQIAAGQLPLEQIVTATLPMERGDEALRRLADPEGEDLKILVQIES